MQKTKPMEMVEAQAGRDIRQVIFDAVKRNGDVRSAAAELRLTPQGLYRWIQLLDGDVDTTTSVRFAGFVPTEEPASEPEAVPA